MAVRDMFKFVLLELVTAVCGTIGVYMGVLGFEKTLTLYGGYAVSMFVVSTLVWLIGCAFFVFSAIIGKFLIDTLKGQ